MLVKGDKVKLIAPVVGHLETIGTEYEVSGVTEDGTVIIKVPILGLGFWGHGAFSPDEFKKHFKKIENYMNEFYIQGEFKDKAGNIPYRFKDTFKTDNKSMVSLDKNGKLYIAKCSEKDKFSLDIGAKVCMAKWGIDYFQTYLDSLK